MISMAQLTQHLSLLHLLLVQPEDCSLSPKTEVLLPDLWEASVVSLDLAVLEGHLLGPQLASEVELLLVNAELEVHLVIPSSALCPIFSLLVVQSDLASLDLVSVLLVDRVG
jgi:hypothetical protein